MSLLKMAKYPEDLRKLKRSELPPLAAEIRERILEVISESGGHLASSLGAVELTIALHYVYQTPKDKLLWDVGHQSYPHKLLTGRNERFPTIRQHKGLSGFPSIYESEYDCLTMGHASTSISAALGMALARDAREEKHHVLAVIGDGAMTGGLAYEGLNNAGARKTDLTVVLNDNSMSISKNVGALSHYLTRIIADPLYNKLKRDVWELTGRMSRLGSGIRKIMANVDEGIKHLVIPGKLFEDLGFRYFGVVDGHNLNELIDVFRNVRGSVSGPVLIHIQTTKGKGFEHAERDATKFHGVGSFEKKSGAVQKKPTTAPTYTSVFAKGLIELARKRPEIVAITAAMPDGTGLKAFGEAFPGRLYDVGIAESHAVTMAAGMAAHGMRPVVALYSTFLQRAFDQMIHDVALNGLPVIFCLDRAGLVGDDGPTHHGYFDISYTRLLPKALVMAPKDEAELMHMLRTAVEYIDGPSFIRYPRGAGRGVSLPSASIPLPIGQPEQILDKGELLLLAIGDAFEQAEGATKILAGKGIRVGLANARFAKPLNTPAFAELMEKYQFIVTVESNCLAGGFGSGINEIAATMDHHPKILSLGYPDRFVEHGTKSLLLKELGLDVEGIAARVAQWHSGH